jgi:hypothetical protein
VILYYALGGGLGHLTRARKVLEALGTEATLLTASRFAGDPRVTGELAVLRVPRHLGRDRDRFRDWLDGALAALRPAELIVDSFPGGILGELCGMALPPARHVARRLRWAAYAQRIAGPLPRYDVIYELEPLSHDHACALTGPIERLTLPVASLGGPLVDEPHWLVVHSGPEHELDRLLAHAVDAPRIVIASPRRPVRLPERAQWRDVYPVAPHLPHAERIVTAAGFNLMQETAHLRDRHTFVPFERALDDQFTRSGFAQELVAGLGSVSWMPGDARERRRAPAR